MNISVVLLEDAAAFVDVAGKFLRSRSVHHNLILTLLDARLTRPEPGRYWVAIRAGRVIGVVFQSPLTHAALVVPMESDALTALVDAIAESGGSLPGVSGDAGTASSFAGQWTERRKSAATPFKGLRIYELIALREIACVEGKLWQADSGDRPLVEEWVGSFSSETGARPTNIERLVDEWLAAGQVWLWQNGEAVSMAVTRVPVEKVVRIASVYTPPDRRRRGYAAACVEGISRQLTEAGLRCMLYTDLANPTSNSIYRQIGYSAVAEGLSYRFHAS